MRAHPYSIRMSEPSDLGASFAEKLEALVTSHRAFVREFERSLENARKFLTLADQR